MSWMYRISCLRVSLAFSRHSWTRALVVTDSLSRLTSCKELTSLRRHQSRVSKRQPEEEITLGPGHARLSSLSSSANRGHNLWLFLYNSARRRSATSRLPVSVSSWATRAQTHQLKVELGPLDFTARRSRAFRLLAPRLFKLFLRRTLFRRLARAALGSFPLGPEGGLALIPFLLRLVRGRRVGTGDLSGQSLKRSGLEKAVRLPVPADSGLASQRAR